MPTADIKNAVMKVLEESSRFVAGPVSFERHHRELAQHVASITISDLPQPQPTTASSSSSSASSSSLSSMSATTKTDSMDHMMEMDHHHAASSNQLPHFPTFTPTSVPFWQALPLVHVYKLDGDGPSQEFTGGGDEEEGISSLEQWCLPCTEFDGLWDNLVYDFAIKAQLLSYCQTAMIFADSRVNNNVITWNRVVLLHGPPGTGKTSLCKALAHKLAIRLSDRYSSGFLLEINAHSLFSKWFSESGKLVTKLFDHIKDMVDDQDALVCVLIDEVESLTAARTGAASGAEPSDAIRVVNAVLTQIDQLRQRDNVLILTTSNISEAIDLAFVDRADIKQYIGLPSAPARYTILSSYVAVVCMMQVETTVCIPCSTEQLWVLYPNRSFDMFVVLL